jgi:hypothetical protein
MQLFADLDQPAQVNANEVDWVASPLAGVDRRMLERDGEEGARATSIVRYAPESFFSPHSHAGGEEYYVLSGIFSDESGDYPAGYYVRNPVNSSHRPFTKEGCQIYVKLRQMHPDDQAYVALDTRCAPEEIMDGVASIALHNFQTETVLIRQPDAEQTYTEQSKTGLELLVLAGEIEIEGERYGPEHWLRYPGEQSLAITAKTGDARLLVKKDHLEII